MTAVNTPVARVDGPAKVTGARPATRRRSACLQWHLSGGRRAVLACAHPRGPPENRCPPSLLPWLAGGATRAESFVAMQDDVVHYAGQPVGHNRRRGVRISQYAASLVRVAYERPPP